MISPVEEEYILSNAYVPEHIVSMMCLISKGEPFLINEYVCYRRDNWLIFVGYPLRYNFNPDDFERMLLAVIKRFQPEYTWFIAPEVPSSLIERCEKKESDYYYKIELEGLKVKKELARIVEKASKDLTVEREKKISKEHRALIKEFLKREMPAPHIRELFLSIPEYVTQSNTAIVLNTRDRKGRLTAFYVVELKAKNFAVYLVGCYSKKNYVPHSSDLLFFEMINLARENGKGYINLGLGVNEGIRKFKEKWGGIPFLRYEFCEYRPSNAHTGILELMRRLESRL